jgi:F-type H+-transporting ATPase subunit gamma
VALIVVTSNRGLCGAFNANLIKEARRRLAELEGAGATVELHLVGRKGIGFFRFLGRTPATQRQDIGDRPTPDHAAEVVQPLMDRFADGRLDAVEIVFAKFQSALSTPPTRLAVLPILPPATAGRGGRFYLLEPGPEAILAALLPLYVRNQIFRALVETAASEQGARRTAMKNATDSAGDMIDTLRRTFNRARQSQITQELAEIVGGAEALKG